MTKPITMQQITKEALKILNDELDKSHKKKYLAVQTRGGTWLVVERYASRGDNPKLMYDDVRLKACANKEEAEGFEKLLRS